MPSSKRSKKKGQFTSSNVAEFSYDPKLKALSVVFHSGSTYVYGHVEIDVYHAMKAAPSKGAFVHQVLKPNYPVIDMRG